MKKRLLPFYLLSATTSSKGHLHSGTTAGEVVVSVATGRDPPASAYQVFFFDNLAKRYSMKFHPNMVYLIFQSSNILHVTDLENDVTATTYNGAYGDKIIHNSVFGIISHDEVLVMFFKY